MEPRLQRRVQRYGWDLAAARYEALWQAQLAPAHQAVLDGASLMPGEAVLDAACGTGLVTLRAAQQVGPNGVVVGVDTSGRMVEVAQRHARACNCTNTSFMRNDLENLALSDASFDVALCSLGLMYMPDAGQALQVMRRALRPGGRLAVAVWGPQARCGWSSVFSIVETEVTSDVCPLFFRLGASGALAALCADAGFEVTDERRIAVSLSYADADEACAAVFLGGPAALAWSRFDANARDRARQRYVDAIEAWRDGPGYEIPGEFVVITAAVSSRHAPVRR